MRRLPVLSALPLPFLLAFCAAAFAQTETAEAYAGRPLVEALTDLRDQGLRLIWGSNVVRADMIVAGPAAADGPRDAGGRSEPTKPPRSSDLRRILDRLLEPHALAVRESDDGILTVIRAPFGILFGTARDSETGEPIEGAEVEVLGLRSLRTDSAGAFESGPTPPAGPAADATHARQAGQAIEARKAGYIIQRREVRVRAGERQRVDFWLNPVGQTLEEMTVIPGQVRLLLSEPAPEVLWTRDDVNRLPHLSDDLFRAVSRLPGIASGDFSADFHVRGGERNEVLVLVDGLRVYDPYHLKDFQNTFSIFDSNATGAIELMSGGFTADYGDRMSGVIEISSLVPTGRGTMTGISFEKVHFLSHGRLENVGGDWMGDWLVNARRGYIDVLLDAVESDDDDFDLRPIYYDAFAKVRRSIGNSGFLALHVLAASDEIEFSSEEDDDDLTSSYSNAYAWVKLDTLHGPRVTQTSVLSWGRLDSDRDGESGANLSDPFFGPSTDLTRVLDKRTTDIGQFRQDWTIDPSDRHHLRTGLEVRSLSANYDYTSFNRVSDPLFTDGERVTERRFDLERDGWTYGLYLADRFRVSERLALEAGLRWDRQTYADDDQLSPRLNLVARLQPRTTLRASWGRYWQSQGIHELQIIDGVDQYQPAQLNQQITLALDRRLGQGKRISAQLYAKRLEDPRPRYELLFETLDIFPEGQSDRVRIAPERGRARGLELLFEDRRNRLDWWITYALSEAEDEIDGEWVRRSWDQRHAVSYSVNLKLGEHWNLNFAGVHHSGWPATDVELIDEPGQFVPRLVPGERNAADYPDYHRIDTRASRSFETKRGTVKLFLEITNLLDRDNIRSVSDFELRFSDAEGFSVVREREKWFPRVPSFGVTWAF